MFSCVIGFLMFCVGYTGSPLSSQGAPNPGQKCDESPSSSAHASEGLVAFFHENLPNPVINHLEGEPSLVYQIHDGGFSHSPLDAFKCI